ncbi:ATP-grasp domain-containing protein [Actinoplanes couchii]|uniref:ATP-grasp domain-containing protein n=1 Tax=Actinoplanes couchii TaxID=403638 RepID=UPI0019404236|nr:hypothetical protein [Actinoplanes couchii]MDR6316792.1 hypothetical protein [Actinoplanes couchii]
MADVEHTVGMLLGAEEDWPRAYEALLRRLGLVTGADGRTHRTLPVRMTVEPFNLRDRARHGLVIDRLSHWYYLKKLALMDDVHLLNSPFTLESMEKHAACCVLMRLGLRIPETVLVPGKPRDRSFDLDAAAAAIGYPLWVKPYDGGSWSGVSKVRTPAELHAAHAASGERLMHLQASVEDYDVVARALTIGPETMVMRFRPEQPEHARYQVEHDFLSAAAGEEVVTVSRLVNAFFRWEFNSCESLVRGDDVFPIDHANACPDVSLTSLHYYFPWAMTALLRWTVFCLVTGRRGRLDMDPSAYFAIADDPDRSYAEKLRDYRRLADGYFEIEKYREFCAKELKNADAIVYDWVCSEEFRSLLRETVRARYPVHEHEKFLAHFGGLIDAWVSDQSR